MQPFARTGLWPIASLALVVLVVWGSLRTGGKPLVPGNVDKLQHFTAYFGLALWFAGLFVRSRYWLVAGALLLLGGSLEVLQELVAVRRSAEWADMAANTAGVLAGLALGHVGVHGWASRVDTWMKSRR
jgi:VanZ family protein